MAAPARTPLHTGRPSVCGRQDTTGRSPADSRRRRTTTVIAAVAVSS